MPLTQSHHGPPWPTLLGLIQRGPCHPHVTHFFPMLACWGSRPPTHTLTTKPCNPTQLCTTCPLHFSVSQCDQRLTIHTPCNMDFAWVATAHPGVQMECSKVLPPARHTHKPSAQTPTSIHPPSSNLWGSQVIVKCLQTVTWGSRAPPCTCHPPAPPQAPIPGHVQLTPTHRAPQKYNNRGEGG